MITLARRALLLSLLVLGSSATADTIVSPDDVCEPHQDPCVIDRPWDVVAFVPLDFGTRTVLVTGDGSLTGDMDLSCGRFEADVEGRWLTISPEGQVSIRARRRCSLDAATPCMVDEDCNENGTCSAGAGSIVLSGDVAGVGAGLALYASGDVSLGATLRFAAYEEGFAPVESGGGVYAESSQGSVAVTRPVYADSAPNGDDIGRSQAGGMTFRARRSVSVSDLLSAVGGLGSVRVVAGEDAILQGPIDLHGGDAQYFDGALVHVSAGRDAFIRPQPGLERVSFDMRGGGTIDRDGSVNGSGGAGIIEAGRDVHVAAGVRINANSGRIRARPENQAYSGRWWFDAGEDLRFEGRLHARGRGPTGWGQNVTMSAGGKLSLAADARIRMRSRDVETLALTSGGVLSIEGKLDVRGGRRRNRDGERTGRGGTVEVEAPDVSMVGLIRTGGGEYGGYVNFDACRLHILSGARIDGSYGEQEDSPSHFSMYVREEMRADEGSILVAAPASSISIPYRDPARPPVLSGTMIPQPTVTLAGWLEACATSSCSSCALRP